MLKSEIYGWLKLEQPTEESREPFPPGYCHFPQMPEEFFKQLTAEQLIVKVVKGYRRPEWVKTRERNEALDTRVYARAAAAQFGIDRFGERQWRALDGMLGTAARQRAAQEAGIPAAGASASPPSLRPSPVRRVIRSTFLER